METKLANRSAGEPYDVYIGRPSKWGNPFTHVKDKLTLAQYVVKDRDAAIDSYRNFLFNRPDLLKNLHELDGKILGCWCTPKRCHGEILIEFLTLRNHISKLLEKYNFKSEIGIIVNDDNKINIYDDNGDLVTDFSLEFNKYNFGFLLELLHEKFEEVMIHGAWEYNYILENDNKFF